MSEEISTIEKLLGDSLENYIMNEAEDPQVAELMAACLENHEKVLMVRKVAFCLARANVEESHQVMDWLERIVKRTTRK